MASRQFPGLLALPALAVCVGLIAGCSSSRPSSYGFQAADLPPSQNLPADPVASPGNGEVAPLPTPAATSPMTVPAPPSPLDVAMVRAGSHYDRGIQAMRGGNSNQAEWEFDAALETLVDGGLNPVVPPRLIDAPQASSISLRDWLSPPVTPPQRVNPESPPLDPDEPTQEAPALLGPEDVQAIETEEAKETPPLPEPDVQKYEFPIVFNDQVKIFLQYFQTQKWGVITRAFERASRHFPMMREVFRQKGLPEELLNLAFIESAVNPWATSRVKAAGIWQFMAPTARLYGMQVSWWVDERRDPEKATRGAADYLKNLYQMFGNWELALAAYNAGEGKVQRAVARQRTNNFWKLRLPKETRLFVPAFMAMTIISKEPVRYGFSPPPDDPFPTETVALDHPVDFRTLARVAGIPAEHFRELNPALIRWSTPPGVSRYNVRIPAGVKADFLEDLARIPPQQRVAWIAHHVRKGETAPAIAKRYGANLQVFLNMNGLKKRQPLKPGGVVLVPSSGAAPAMTTVDAGVEPSGRKTGRGETARHTVRRGETVTQIARIHGVSPHELRRVNDLPQNASLRPGQKLKLPASTTQEASRAARKNVASAVAPPLSPPPAERRYTVKRGDTLAEIARVHGVSEEDLRRWNRLPRSASLRPGQTLRILDSPS